MLSMVQDGGERKEKEEKGKACCSFKRPGLSVLWELQATWGAHTGQTDTTTYLHNMTAGRPHVRGQCWIPIGVSQLLSPRAELSPFPSLCKKNRKKILNDPLMCRVWELTISPDWLHQMLTALVQSMSRRLPNYLPHQEEFMEGHVGVKGVY
jgi:hypothetical protein